MVSVCHKTLSESTEYYTIIIFFPLPNMKFRGLVVRTPTSHSEVWGSIPPQAVLLFFKGFTSFSKIIVIKGNFLLEWPALWRITMNSLRNEDIYK